MTVLLQKTDVSDEEILFVPFLQQKHEYHDGMFCDNDADYS